MNNAAKHLPQGCVGMCAPNASQLISTENCTDCLQICAQDVSAFICYVLHLVCYHFVFEFTPFSFRECAAQKNPSYTGLFVSIIKYNQFELPDKTNAQTQELRLCVHIVLKCVSVIKCSN